MSEEPPAQPRCPAGAPAAADDEADAATGPRHRVFLLAAAANLLRHRGRTLATMACLLAVLTPLLVAAAVSKALVETGREQIRHGPDLLVSGDPYGRGGTIPLSLAEEIGKLPGVERVEPRIVGRVWFEGRTLTLLATDAVEPVPGAVIAEGRGPRPGPGPDEAVVGASIAATFEAYPGTGLAIEGNRVRLFKVVGIFSPAAPLATASMLWTTFQGGARLYDRPGEATELAIYTRPGYAMGVVEAIGQQHRALRLQTRPMMQSYLERGHTLKAGSFAMLWLLLLAALIPVVAITSGIGLRERSREVALCRALGWHMGELLELSLLEDLLLAAAASGGAALLAWSWVHLLHGAGIASIFLPGIGLTPEVPVPAIFVPEALLLAWVTTTSVMLIGSLAATWRAAAMSPAAVLR